MKRFDVISNSGQMICSLVGDAEPTPLEYWGEPDSYTITVTDLTGTPQDPPWVYLRKYRDELLRLSDWTQMADSPLSTEAKAAWASYRQALRNLPDQPGLDPVNPTWPTPPS